MEPTIKPNQGMLSVEIKPNGVAVAYNLSNSSSDISFCDFKEFQTNIELTTEEFKNYMMKLSLKYRLKKNKCLLTLHPSYYRLTLVNVPHVPRSEYKKAIRWQIKDIVSYPLEDVAIDIFYPGEDEENVKKIYVVAAQNSFLQKIVNVLQDCGLYPIAIDIREFAIRNLISSITRPEEIVGFLDLSNDGSILVLVKDKRVQFVRHFPLNLNMVKGSDYGDLSKEIQRSFNYCQSELGQELPSKIFLPPTEGIDVSMIKGIETGLQKETSTFSLRDVVNLKIELDKKTEIDCWSAVGGALRNVI